MGRNFVLFLLVIFATTTGKYVYVPQAMTWPDAQQHCWNYYTDMASISNWYDTIILQRSNPRQLTWIGLMKNTADGTEWMWSGGSKVVRSFWSENEPIDYPKTVENGAIQNYTWYAKPDNNLLTFSCYKVHAVQERKTWEEALEYCRRYHNDLASVASETEMMLMQKELRKQFSSEYVWIGLSFLSGDWMWVDGQPRGYEAWGSGGKNWCPAVNMTCAALKVIGLKFYNSLVNILVRADNVQEWIAHDCNDRLYFLCY